MTSISNLDSERTKVVHVKDDYDVYIGRAMPGRRASEFQNPFRIGPDGTRAEVLAKHRVHLKALLEKDPGLRARLQALKGKRLGCWCKPLDCHGDFIAELLDGPLPPEPEAPPAPQMDLF